MKKISAEAEKIMFERFGKDTVIALATVENGIPYVRSVNAYYENGSFYIITYALSLTVDFPLPCQANRLIPQGTEMSAQIISDLCSLILH